MITTTIKATSGDIDRWTSEAKKSADTYDNVWDKLAVNWPILDENSTVFEVGSYKGRWAYQIAKRYNPRLYCFEPQGWAYETTRKLLKDSNAQVFNYGLGTLDGRYPMTKYGTDGCSFTRESFKTEFNGDGEIKEIAAAIENLHITSIDLMLINIEGYEHILIPYMLDNGIVPNILMVQMHGNDKKTVEKVNSIYNNLLFDYGGTLRAWQK